MTKEVVLFLGPPGAGKGSLSHLCVKRLGWVQLSTGNLCREHIAEGTEIGEKIDFAIKSGKLVSDDLIVDMVGRWLEEALSGDQTVIFDGFPRTVPQAEALQKLVEKRGDISLRLVRLTMLDNDLMSRLLARAICSDRECQTVYSVHEHSSLKPRKPGTCDECKGVLVRRSDDEESAIAKRLKVYHEHEKGLLSFYEKIGQTICNVEAHQPLEEVYCSFIEMTGYSDK